MRTTDETVTQVTPQHTPGPWHTGAGDMHRIKAGRGCNAVTVAQVAYPIQSDDRGEAHLADCFLIAAAPDLLEACRTSLANCETLAAASPGVGTYDKWAEMLRGVIAKAGGAQ